MALVEFTCRKHVGEVVLNRPAALNAINDEMEALLAAAWEQIDGDPGIWVAVLRSQGTKAFCAGGDMREPPQGHAGLSLGGGITGIGGRFRPLRKPLVCAVNGYALGLGFEIALCADILLASSDARFSLPETRNGVIGHCGVVHRAIRQLPHHIALALIIAGETLDAASAARFGLVNECVDVGGLPDAIDRWISKLLQCSPLVAQAAKAAATAGLGVSLPTALSQRYPSIDAYQSTADAAEATAAWRGRRAPVWRGG
ncbi:MAG: crotonase [Hydrocarboniphaga sp.]|uniref:enoyl-CoA hydratase-related protein n=1 Tax=Hydrocarboniphaga sp. TaxID=2033016 RepID=UPI002611B3E7|nr:enoyl-CoA hydratase-related protein [Hydrocarboniphaga sp.]MDB5972816.1 crotonase [Hydrocarboniphaga sp.]